MIAKANSAPAETVPAQPAPEISTPQKLPAGGTVVLDVEEGGIEVPSFLGKSLRAAIEVAQDVGLDLDAVGSGVAREQSPLPGARVAAGSRITVRFGR
jgi:cell division protein FtsI (penicillin-binding protein 3)